MAAREEEKKHFSQLESLVNNYEKKNRELEEKELEARYRLQMLENTMPALLMWNLMRLMITHVPGSAGGTQLPSPSDIISNTEGILPTREEELMTKVKALEQKLITETKLLEDSKLTEEQLRSKIKNLEHMLINKDTNILEILERDPEDDVQIFEKLSRLAKERIDKDKLIKSFEMKEKLYQQTIEHTEELYAQMEGNYLKQIKEKEEELQEQGEKLIDTEGRYRQAAKSSLLVDKLNDQITLLESEVTRMKEILCKKEQEKEKLEKEEQQLKKEFQHLSKEYEKVRDSIKGPLALQLDAQKKKVTFLEREIADSEDRRAEEAESHRVEIAVYDTRGALKQAQDEKEQLREEYESKLEGKEIELELAKKQPPPVQPRSLKEEFEDVIEEKIEDTKLQKIQSTLIGEHYLVTDQVVADDVYTNNKNFNNFSTTVSYSIAEKPEIMEPPKSPPPPPPVEEIPPEISADTLYSLAHSNFEQKVYSVDVNMILNSPLDNTYMGTSIITGLNDKFNFKKQFIENKEIPKDEISEYQLYLTNLPKECEIAQRAVTGATGKNLPTSMDNLSKAYQHSKNCKKCNETLGEFLNDIIQQLGVQLPRAKGIGDPKGVEYGGQPSTLTTKDPTGPGTVGYDPNKNPDGYKLKPTVSTLALTVEELRDKMRVKDHMIEMLADEIRRIGQKTNWSSTDLMADIGDQPTTDPIDFDRRALNNYLNLKPIHGLQTPSEVEHNEEYPATNPLGLKVTRQIGPDSIMVRWAPPPESSDVYAFEIFVNGFFLQRIRSPGRNKSLVYPVDLSSKLFITLNAMSYDGEITSTSSVGYP